jgi:hypothetical protein
MAILLTVPGPGRFCASRLPVDVPGAPQYHYGMLRRLRRRRLVRWIAFSVISVALFAGGIRLALFLAGSSPTHVVRVLHEAPTPPQPYSVQQNGQSVRVHQQDASGQEQDLEVKNTDQGVLISPANK